MVIPILRIYNREKALEFYQTYLGFEVDWEHRFEEGFPLYLQVSLGQDVILHLSEHHGDASPGAAIRIRVDDVSSYHASLTKKKYVFANPNLEVVPWGTPEKKELTVIDPFSNRLVFYSV
ncbi:glyoxalase superfamily protein [Sporosarcina sp. OR05]|uniref:glyoxalase superfamily protein n=1 Tax=Sporosarcina sp. OR05 TaxID=2969819 RepID=UPI00352A5764